MKQSMLSRLMATVVCGAVVAWGFLAEAKTPQKTGPSDCLSTQLVELSHINKIDVGKSGNSLSINAGYSVILPDYDESFSSSETADLPFCPGVDRDAGQVMLNEMTNTVCSDTFRGYQSVWLRLCGGPKKCINGIEVTYLQKQPKDAFAERGSVQVSPGDAQKLGAGQNVNSGPLERRN